MPPIQADAPVRSNNYPDASLLTPPRLSVEQPTFARHDTFAPRFGWLKKGYEAAVADPAVFSSEDAPVRLGVGKNMVRAIKHWTVATGLIADDASTGRRFDAVPTPLGQYLLGENGVDPFLEDLASLWLLHWRLVGNADLATGWWYGFYRFSASEFEVDDLTDSIAEFVDGNFTNTRFARSSYKKDASCFVRMYGEMATGFAGEETIHSPFAELSLLRPVDNKRYGFQIGGKLSLPDEIVLFAAAEFTMTRGTGIRSVPLAALVREPGSPGLAFRLGEAALYSALERAVEGGAVKIADSGGIIQVIFDAEPSEVARTSLAQHYTARSGAVI